MILSCPSISLSQSMYMQLLAALARAWHGFVRLLRLGCLLGCALVTLEGQGRAEPIPWKELETGLEYAEFDRGDESKSTIVLLRFNPAFFTFRLHSISEEGGQAQTLRQWADKHSLVAAINASMYLPDGHTSTGYMRHHEHVNSKRVVGRFGAFFVAQLYHPEGEQSPSATLLDKDMDPWETELPKYVSVVQNYRMINAQRRVLWSAGGPLYSISAVGKDGAGNILFIHCREPIEAYTFATLLLALPIDVRTVMYVEGGAQAGLLVNTSKYARAWAGRSPVDFLITGNINAPLPNILGVVRGSQKAPEPSPPAAKSTEIRPSQSGATSGAQASPANSGSAATFPSATKPAVPGPPPPTSAKPSLAPTAPTSPAPAPAAAPTSPAPAPAAALTSPAPAPAAAPTPLANPTQGAPAEPQR